MIHDDNIRFGSLHSDILVAKAFLSKCNLESLAIRAQILLIYTAGMTNIFEKNDRFLESQMGFKKCFVPIISCFHKRRNSCLRALTLIAEPSSDDGNAPLAF